MEWYCTVQGGDFGTKVKGVARAVGGGELDIAFFPNHSFLQGQARIITDQRERRLDWLVLNEVGLPLKTFRSTKELVQVFADVINGIFLHHLPFHGTDNEIRPWKLSCQRCPASRSFCKQYLD